MNTTYAEAYAERWPTAEQVEQEAYGRRPRKAAPKPPKRQPPAVKPPPVVVVLRDPADAVLVRILGGIPKPTAPR